MRPYSVMSGRRSAQNPHTLRIVAIGGGNGLSCLLHGLKQYMGCDVTDSGTAPVEIALTAIVTVTDDGGSSGRLRRDFAVLPPGDIRNCLVAMSEDEALLSQMFNYRFSSGKGLKGHSLGNLFLTALTELTGDFATAVQHASDVLAICGRIYPSTSANVSLEAVMENGSVVEGESRISKSKLRIQRVNLRPVDAKPMAETLKAIADADLITLGPGSLFTSVIPNLLVKGIPEAIATSQALKVYFTNLMWQPGETIQFTAADHVQAIIDHAGLPVIDVVVVNDAPIPALLQSRYAEKRAMPVENDVERLSGMGLSVVHGELASDGEKVRHDSRAIADIAVHLAGEGHLRRTLKLKSA